MVVQKEKKMWILAFNDVFVLHEGSLQGLWGGLLWWDGKIILCPYCQVPI